MGTIDDRNNAASDEPGESGAARQVVVPVVEEELVAGRKQVKTGSVRVEKHVERRTRRVDMPLMHEDVEVQRVPVNRVVSEPPPIRKKGDTIIVPVVEEQMVVSKRLVLKEEIHLVRRRTRDRAVREVQLDRERAEVKRLDEKGRIVAAPETPKRAPARRRSVLD
jgi:uncharacterized protein (TIGR02271 family)